MLHANEGVERVEMKYYGNKDRKELFLRVTLRTGMFNIDGLVQERRNSSALAMELRLSCTNSSIWFITIDFRSISHDWETKFQ